MQCRMDHIVINVHDIESMIEFYTGVLQLEAERLAPFRAGEVPFPSVRLNKDTIIDLFPKRLWFDDQGGGQGPANLNHLCLALAKADWDRLAARLRTGGLELEEGPVPRWGAHGTGVSIYFRDPECNLIEARYYADGQGSGDCLLGT